jgi:uncharacterized protein
MTDRSAKTSVTAKPPQRTCVRLGSTVPYLESSPRQAIAEEGLILRVLVGSTVHGTAISGQDDRDEMGVCIEGMRTVIGSGEFKHYVYRTQPEGVCSGPGDLDLTVYGLRRYAGLATAGNPTILLPLFVPDRDVLYVNKFGRELRERRSMFLSRRAGDRFLGYLESQRQGMMGLRSGGTNNQGRADIRARYGFDTKFAAHMVRLGIQGLELIETGVITLPVPEPDLTQLRAIRQGQWSLSDCLDRATHLEGQIREAMATSPLAPEPDLAAIDAWVVEAHRRFWGWKT